MRKGESEECNKDTVKEMGGDKEKHVKEEDDKNKKDKMIEVSDEDEAKDQMRN